MITEKRKFGNVGEDLAVKYLKKNKYSILERNFTTTFGEIDIIAKDVKKDVIVFVEVKRRLDGEFALPSQNVNYSKRQKISKVATFYLQKMNLVAFTRFDVIEIIGDKINHIIGAFYLEK